MSWADSLAGLAARLDLTRGARREIERAGARGVRVIDNRTPVPLARTMGDRRSMFYGTTGAEGYLTYLSVYSQDGVVYPIVSRLAESVAGQDWGLWTKSASGIPEDRRAVRSHGVLDLFARPNNFQTMSHIIEAGQQHWDLVGEADIILGFAGGVQQPIDMWLLRPDRIQPIPDSVDFLAGWIYTSPDGGERIPLDVRELMRIVHPSPVDPYRGAGAVQALLRDLDAQRFSKEWQAAFFENSARPGGVIEVDHDLGDDQFDMLREQWNSAHKGVSKAHRVAILESGMKWVENQHSLRDMQIAELDAVGRDKALVAFGMPKSILGIVEDVNRANAEAGEYLFARWMVEPRLKRWRSMFNQQLLPLYGPRTAAQYELDFESPIPPNEEGTLAALTSKATVLVSLVGAGADPARVLEMLDWPDLGIEQRDLAAEAEAKNAALAQGRAADEKVKPKSSDGPQDWSDPSVDMAMRWKVVGHPDHNCCDPCLKNLGKLYRNRQSAWSDYPNGRSYIKCIGEQYGNHCRCRVIKRRES